MSRHLTSTNIGCLLLALTIGPACSADDGDTDTEDKTDTELLGDPDVTGRWPQLVPNGFVLHDLGVVTTAGGMTEPLLFTASAEARALHVVGISHANTFVLVTEARAPDGSLWIAAEPPQPVSPEIHAYAAGFPGAWLSPNPTIVRPRAAAALLPNTPALAMQSGPWSFRLGVHRVRYDEQAGVYDNAPLDAAIRVGVLERVSDPPVSGTIDLTLTIAMGGSSGSGLIDAATAPTDPTLQGALAFINDAFAPVGIELGEVAYQDAPDLEQSVDLGGPACLGGPEVEAAFDRAPEPRPGSLQVLLIGLFQCETSGGDIGPMFAGLSNGIPGRPLATRDGLLLSTRFMTQIPDIWQKVLAHELGHHLGVFHTCEGEIDVCDNIADTPEGAEAAANIMFPDISVVTDFVFTPQQGEVMRLSPLVNPS